jgi:hypothetical protein
MNQNKVFNIKNLKIITVTLILILFIIAINSEFISKYENYNIANKSLIFLFNFLTPFTIFFIFILIIYKINLIL